MPLKCGDSSQELTPRSRGSVIRSHPLATALEVELPGLPPGTGGHTKVLAEAFAALDGQRRSPRERRTGVSPPERQHRVRFRLPPAICDNVS